MRQKIFVPKVPVEKMPLRYGLYYSYMGGMLKIYDGDLQELWSNNAKSEEIYMVMYDKKQIFVEEVKLPEKKNNIIAFLIGCGRRYRVRTKEMCDQWAEQLRGKHVCPGYEERVCEGKRYKIVQWCAEDEEYQTMCCYIAENITKEDVLKLIPLMVYPYGFTQKVLIEQFGISTEEFNEAAMADIDLY